MTKALFKPYLKFLWSINDWTGVDTNFRDKNGIERVLGATQSSDRNTKQYIVWNLKTGNLVKNASVA